MEKTIESKIEKKIPNIGDRASSHKLMKEDTPCDSFLRVPLPGYDEWILDGDMLSDVFLLESKVSQLDKTLLSQQ